ncbi:hypothetical protein E4U42_004482 [Claviceps africana]|uniref:Extracellular serine-rich protein n=1 Tax=Claviceps africana TaxID=83212 RepID=A0A8K0J7D7_9HYPO|nr:hypothetical protein E4U42_004482 [Claviceps africana]
MFFSWVVVAALVVAAQAIDVHVVAVGKNPHLNQTALKFFPDKVQARPGSMVQFQFRAGNHTVTQSTFDKPCVPISSVNASVRGIFSSFQPVAASRDTGMIPVFTVLINDTRPVWLYCSQVPHCQMGMAMVINENTAANATRSLENYVKLARNVQQPWGVGIPMAGASNTSRPCNETRTRTEAGTGTGTWGGSSSSLSLSGSADLLATSAAGAGGGVPPAVTTSVENSPVAAQTTAPLTAGGRAMLGQISGLASSEEEPCIGDMGGGIDCLL